MKPYDEEPKKPSWLVIALCTALALVVAGVAAVGIVEARL